MEHCKPVRCKCIAQFFSCTLLISNSMISRETWRKVFQRRLRQHSSFGGFVLATYAIIYTYRMRENLVCLIII